MGGDEMSTYEKITLTIAAIDLIIAIIEAFM